MSRRTFLRGSASLGATVVVPNPASVSNAAIQKPTFHTFSFEPVPANTKDTVSLPNDFSWHVIIRWGDPLWSSGTEFDPNTRGTASSQEFAFGDNNDGMELFTKGDRNILTVNNEYTNLPIIYGNRSSKLPETIDDIRKGKMAIGVSVIEISQHGGRWSILKDSVYNRRITAETPTQMTGPAR